MFRVIVILLALFSSFFASAEIGVGDEPYKLIGKNGSGEKINLDNYKGKVVVITFWATWCGPCMKEIPVLSTIQKEVSTEHLQVIAISYKESRKTFRDVVEALGHNPIIFSFDGRSRVAGKYGVKAIPHMYIIGRDGTVKFKHIGYSEKQIPKLIEEINTLLAEKS
ncbi:TlpA family protein disulfide reductase [Teredinibacter turnerae]|uniref:TlpA family protein disulfide reductase n=1 Tax=Teredinibacter turnerae TaxID=2426 RepID=UPI0004902430|nr:TlpA disulfide reductase family protein [Teredinibacter turnerae]